MAVQRIDLNIENFKGIYSTLKKLAIIIGVLSFIGFIVGGFSFGSFFSVLFSLTFLLLVPYMLYLKVSLSSGSGVIKKNADKIIDNLVKNYDFTPSYTGPGICIDDTKKKMAFFFAGKSEALICDYKDLRKWYIAKEEMSSTTINKNGFNSATVNTKVDTLFTHIVVQLASPEYPEYRFLVPSGLGGRQADMWIARISALVNG